MTRRFRSCGKGEVWGDQESMIQFIDHHLICMLKSDQTNESSASEKVIAATIQVGKGAPAFISLAASIPGRQPRTPSQFPLSHRRRCRRRDTPQNGRSIWSNASWMRIGSCTRHGARARTPSSPTAANDVASILLCRDNFFHIKFGSMTI